MHTTIITPCYNEEEVIIHFLQQLESVLAELDCRFTVLVVDDSSSDGTLRLLEQYSFRSSNITLQVLSLPANVGHQAAIYEGMKHASRSDSAYFIIMDSDGQDAPGAIPQLLDNKTADVVHVVRGRRSEPALFKLLYYCYRTIFRLMTGKQMNVGNYCLINRQMLERTLNTGFRHLAAYLVQQKCQARYVVADRSPRIAGKSKMGYSRLVIHALRSFAECYSTPGFVKRAVSQ